MSTKDDRAPLTVADLIRDDGGAKCLHGDLSDPAPAPIDMILHCPACGLQHVDAPETDEQYNERLFESSWWECGGDKPERWTNPPHRSHLCHGCGHIWRPADVATNGVREIKTQGKNDTRPRVERAMKVVYARCAPQPPVNPFDEMMEATRRDLDELRAALDRHIEIVKRRWPGRA
jgi:hypothetical protein